MSELALAMIFGKNRLSFISNTSMEHVMESVEHVMESVEIEHGCPVGMQQGDDFPLPCKSI